MTNCFYKKSVGMLLGGSKKGGRLSQHKMSSVSCPTGIIFCPTGPDLDSVFVLFVPFVLDLG